MVKNHILFLTVLLLQLKACNLGEEKFEQVSSVPQVFDIQHQSSSNKKLPSLAESVVAYPAEDFPAYAQITLFSSRRFDMKEALILSRAYRDRFNPAYKKLLVCLTENEKFYNHSFKERCYALIEYTGPQLSTEKRLVPGLLERSMLWMSDLFK